MLAFGFNLACTSAVTLGEDPSIFTADCVEFEVVVKSTSSFDLDGEVGTGSEEDAEIGIGGGGPEGGFAEVVVVGGCGGGIGGGGFFFAGSVDFRNDRSAIGPSTVVPFLKKMKQGRFLP
jgi:hypothetical protein